MIPTNDDEFIRVAGGTILVGPFFGPTKIPQDGSDTRVFCFKCSMATQLTYG